MGPDIDGSIENTHKPSSFTLPTYFPSEVMPIFQGAYNFELHGGSFYDAARHHRHHHRHHQASGTNRTSTFLLPPTHQRSTSLPDHLPPSLLNSDSVDSERTIDEEAQVVPAYPGCLGAFWTSLTDTLLGQVYMHLLMQLPSHYFNRVDRISRVANLALKELLDMAVQADTNGGKDFQDGVLDLGHDFPPVATDSESLPHSYHKLTTGWCCFLDNLLEEWKTLNLVSALLIPGILTMFQVTGAANDPVTRYLAFWSLLSALLSLLYGCSFIIQFSRMRKPSIVLEWAFEAQNPQSNFWSVWVMLSLPVVWLAWSIIAFIICIMAFMWRSGANSSDHFVASPSTELGFRCFISAVLGVGVFYGILIFTSFQRYGMKMDDALSRRIDTYVASAAKTPPSDPTLPSNPLPTARKPRSRKLKNTNTRPRSNLASLPPLQSSHEPNSTSNDASVPGSSQPPPSSMPALRSQPSPSSSSHQQAPTFLVDEPKTNPSTGRPAFWTVSRLREDGDSVRQNHVSNTQVLEFNRSPSSDPVSEAIPMMDENDKKCVAQHVSSACWSPLRPTANSGLDTC